MNKDLQQDMDEYRQAIKNWADVCHRIMDNWPTKEDFNRADKDKENFERTTE